MSVVKAVISSGTQIGETVDIEVPTVRVPELSDAETPLEDDDLILLYKNDPTAKTRKTTLAALRNYNLVGNSGEPTTPVTFGSQIEIIVTALNGGGTNTITVPMLAGYEFTLDRQGVGTLQSDEYSILPGGGFKLSAKDANGKVVPDSDPAAFPQIAQIGERFTAKVFNLVATPTPTGNNSGGGSEFSGIALITSSTQLTTIHRGKLLHCALGNLAGTITLEDLGDAPKYSTITIETNVSNTKQTRIETKQISQKIYFAGTSLTYLYLGISQSIKLFVGDDGYYLISNAEFLLNIGKPHFDYAVRLNTAVANGQLVRRADYPRLWDFVQTLDGISLVDDSLWNVSQDITNAETGTMTSFHPYEGCFSKGDGSTTFRLPNLQGKFIRGLNNVTLTGLILGDDTERGWDKAGGVQSDMLRKHDHDEQVYTAVNDGGKKPVGYSNTLNDLSDSGTDTGLTGGFETRPINVGLIPLIYV